MVSCLQMVDFVFFVSFVASWLSCDRRDLRKLVV